MFQIGSRQDRAVQRKKPFFFLEDGLCANNYYTNGMRGPTVEMTTRPNVGLSSACVSALACVLLVRVQFSVKYSAVHVTANASGFSSLFFFFFASYCRK